MHEKYAFAAMIRPA